jgi:hypothetical protein
MRRQQVVRGLLLVAAGLSAAVFLAVTGYYLSTASSWGDVLASFWWDAWLGFAAVGGMLVFRRPEEPIGRLLTLMGFFAVLTMISAGYADHDFRGDHRLGTLGMMGALAVSPAFAAAFACASATVLTFPSGHLDTTLRRIGGRFISAGWLLTTVGYLGRPRQQLGEGHWVDNPLHVAGTGGAGNVVLTAGIVALFASAVLAVSGAIVTFRMSMGDERQQMRWFVRSAAVLPLSFVVGVSVASLNSGLSDLLVFLGLVGGFNAIAVAIGIAVARYRLYDVDRVVSRTASYAAVTGLVVGGYVGLVALIESVLGFSSAVAVAASTLVAAAAFQPLRRRVQRAIDRKFDRATYDARRTVEAFAARLRDQVDVATIRAGLVATASAAVKPQQASVWLVNP